jgi:hypothetical protein
LMQFCQYGNYIDTSSVEVVAIIMDHSTGDIVIVPVRMKDPWNPEKKIT